MVLTGADDLQFRQERLDMSLEHYTDVANLYTHLKIALDDIPTLQLRLDHPPPDLALPPLLSRGIITLSLEILEILHPLVVPHLDPERLEVRLNMIVHPRFVNAQETGPRVDQDDVVGRKIRLDVARKF
jgi:hypothetical protein